MMKEQIPVIKIDDVSKVVAQDAYIFNRRVRRKIYFVQQDGAAMCLELEAQNAQAVSIGAAEAAGQSWAEAEAPATVLPAHGIEELRDAGEAVLVLINSFRRSPDQNMRSLLGLVGLEAVGLMPEMHRLAWLKEMELSAETAARMFAAERDNLLGPSEPEIGKVVS